MDESDVKKLVEAALSARETAYAPYSNFKVGAALLSKNGTIFKGCNVENASYGASICAERTAFVKAVSEGEREFKAIAIAGGDSVRGVTGYAYPCGICRQVMLEFCDRDFTVIVARSAEDYKCHSLEEIIPLGFSADDLSDSAIPLN